MIDALGGRKFLVSILIIAVGTAVQIYSPLGVTEAFTALLVGIAATFGATNAWVTTVMDGKQPAGQPASQLTAPAVDPELVNQAINAVHERAGAGIMQAQEALVQVDQVRKEAASHAEAIANLAAAQESTQKLLKMAIQIK